MLRKQTADTAQESAALLQLSTATFLPPHAKKVLDAFLSRDTETQDSVLLQMAAPEANAYEFQSQGIIDMLTKLLGKFEDERTELEKTETEAVHSFEMLAAALKNQLATANSARSDNAEAKAKALQGAADSKGALADTTGTRDDDTKYAAHLTATCEQKSTDLANRQILRQEEIEAITKAKEILGSGAVAGAGEKHLPQLIQSKSTSWVQLRAAAENPNQKRVIAYLKRQASSR